MPDFLLLMHDDATADPAAWPVYSDRLRKADAFAGGSAIGKGVALKKSRPTAEVTHHIVGYIRIMVADLAAACELVQGTPVYSARCKSFAC